jgi:phospholipid transport system substrate-binding protein
MMFTRLVAVTCRFSARMTAVPLAAMMFAMVIAHPARGGTPAEEIQGAVEKVVSILNDPNLKAPAKRQERLEQLRRVIYPKFDFAEMAKRSLGSHWQKRSAQEQREFVKLFTLLIENAYMENLETYDGEKVAITGQQQEREYAEVRSRIGTKQGQEYSVDYKLMRTSDNWKIYDVVIENISLVNNYRSQFNRVVAQSSFEELLKRMKDKRFEGAGKKQKT